MSMAIMRMRGLIPFSLLDGLGKQEKVGRYYRCMKVEKGTKRSSSAGSRTGATFSVKPGEAGSGPEAVAVYDRRGVKLPAKALVGGIITPQ
jgi:hypothetical protein